MVKRKRTLSVKDNNSENVNQTSDADQFCDNKRSKVSDCPLKTERPNNGLDHSTSVQSPNMPPASQTSLTSGSSGLTVPADVLQSLPDVPLSTTPVVSQTRPTPQLRTSARVLNKQRREETKADLANLTALVAPNKKLDGNVKSEFPDEEDGNAGTGNNEKKRRRAWELWSTEDKNIFFESINECGKDFEAIQNYITTKLRKKGTPGYQIKNKDQVRHFYYRTWHKISKHITFSEGVKKQTQELYGLINYGELRKKVGGTLDEKKAQKLQELINQGSTSVRVKGKSLRVRTPICRALKKLNQIEEHREQTEVRVPQSISVEIVPKSVKAWCHVQGLAHNPRVRVTTSLQKPLSVLLSHLQEKWKSSDLKLRETLASRANFPLEVEPVVEPVLRLSPPQGICIKPLNVQADVMMKSSAVSLQSHEAWLRRQEENISKCDKKRENKQLGSKALTMGEESSSKDGDEIGKLREQTMEAERSGISAEEVRADRSGEQGNGATDKGSDVEILPGDADDFAGEVSQEEMEDGSDGEPDCLNSPEVDLDDVGVISTENHLTLPVYVKEEPLDCMSPPTSILDPLDINHMEDPFDPDMKVKEEGESVSALRQLMALETVANSQNVENDPDVVCVGESTRLTSHVGEGNKGQSTAASQGELASEERNMAVTPEPEEEEKDLEAEEKPSSAEIDEYVEKIRGGWILGTARGITIGELYLMFGQNKKITLEYEFEITAHKESDEKLASPLSSDAPKDTLESSPSRSGVSSVNEIVKCFSTPTSSSVGLLPFGQANSGENEKMSITIGEESLSPNCKDSYKDELGDKSSTVENLSGMLTHLLTMARIILAKPPSNSCSCGHVCGRGGGSMRSPASGRGQGLNGIGRSPGSTRSPRNSRINSLNAQSPGGMRSPVAQKNTRSPLAAKQTKDRVKPSSAKKLIPDQQDSNVPLLSDGSGSAELTAIIAPLPNVVSQDQGAKVPVTSIGSSTTATTLTGVKVVVGAGGDGGEFRVPTAPAPRPVQAQQANFNAQLTKLLPRYKHRPGRVMRKSVVVQRQLPLLPKSDLRHPGVIAMKVLPQVSQKIELTGSEMKGYIPISKAPSTHGSQLIATPQVIKLEPTLQVRNPLATSSLPIRSQLAVTPHDISANMPLISTNQLKTNAISVNVSGQPLLTVEMPTPVTMPSKVHGNVSNSGMSSVPNSTGVDVSDLMKPSSMTSTNAQPTNSVSPVKTIETESENSNLLTPRKIDNLINSTIVVPHNFSFMSDREKTNSVTSSSSAKSTATSCTSINGMLSSMVSEALGDLPDLSTPPGTPQPFCSTKIPNNESTTFLSHLEGISSASTSSSYPRIPSPSLFNSSLSLDSLPGLNSGLSINTQLVSTIPSSTVSLQSSSIPSQNLSPTNVVANLISNSTSLSIDSPLLSTATTSHLELSPPRMQTNTFASLLNTPNPHSADSNSSSSVHQPSSPPLPTIFHSSDSIVKGFTSLLEPLPRTSNTPTISVPELHIPEGTLNLPMLDISIGGTVTLNNQTSGILNRGADVKDEVMPSGHVIKMNPSSPVRSSTPTQSCASDHRIQDNSSDKLLDITLGMSNSNSSFSSLLASATQTPRVLDSSILGALNLESLDCPTDSTNRGVSSNILDGIPGVEISGFPALDSSTPSPPPSPSRLLQQGDNQWLNNEVNDFSLSSFLGHFESPIKGSSNSRGASQSNPSDTAIPRMVNIYNENSVDFTAKFAEMKAKASQSFKN